jgi:hypothetical protein
MNNARRFLVLGSVTAMGIVIVLLMKPIPQSQQYHLFADRRSLAGLFNFMNVVSNLPFVVTGLAGWWALRRSAAGVFMNIMYAVIFAGIFLTGIGSAWYHYAPGNNSLVYDRLPMVIVFMGFLCATIAGWINYKAGIILFLPLLVTGIASVLFWHYSERKGAGDLRFYAFVQFYPMIIIPLIYYLFASAENNRGLTLLVKVIIWYAAAKVLELLDKQIYQLTGFLSGHSLKHIAAAIATWYMVQFFVKKYGTGGRHSIGATH